VDHGDRSPTDVALEAGWARRDEPDIIRIHSGSEPRSLTALSQYPHLVVAEDIGKAAVPDHPDDLARKPVFIDGIAGNEDVVDLALESAQSHRERLRIAVNVGDHADLHGHEDTHHQPLSELLDLIPTLP
jgi:hypothetical protein